LLRAPECKLTRVIRDGRTALHWAVDHHQSASIEALVKMKADAHLDNATNPADHMKALFLLSLVFNK
jgi:hypothetical protein